MAKKKTENKGNEFSIYCWWDGGNGGHEKHDVYPKSMDELLAAVEKTFIEGAGAIYGVDSFDIVCEYTPYEYQWDNDYLPRNRTLSDVWDEERENIKEYFKEVFENENQK